MLNVKLLKQFKYSRDVYTTYFLLKNGKGACMSFIGGTYDKNPRSIFGSQTRIMQTDINRKVYQEFYKVVPDFLLYEVYNNNNDFFKFNTLSGIPLVIFRLKRKIRIKLFKKKRNILYKKIIPKL